MSANENEPVGQSLNTLKQLMSERPNETLSNIDAELPDFSKLAQLPAMPNQQTWWQDLRNAYGLHTVLLRDMMVKLNNFVDQYQKAMGALVAIVEAFSDEEELSQNKFEAEQDAAATFAAMQIQNRTNDEPAPASEPVPFSPFGQTEGSK